MKSEVSVLETMNENPTGVNLPNPAHKYENDNTEEVACALVNKGKKR